MPNNVIHFQNWFLDKYEKEYTASVPLDWWLLCSSFFVNTNIHAGTFNWVTFILSNKSLSIIRKMHTLVIYHTFCSRVRNPLKVFTVHVVWDIYKLAFVSFLKHSECRTIRMSILLVTWFFVCMCMWTINNLQNSSIKKHWINISLIKRFIICNNAK